MQYVITYGQEYLKDFGDGWTRWTTVSQEAMRFDEKLIANRTAARVDATAIPYIDPNDPYATKSEPTPKFCGAI